MSDLCIARLRPEDRLCFITLLCVTNMTDDTDERSGIVERFSEDVIIQMTHLQDDPYDHELSSYGRAEGFAKRLEEEGLISFIDETTIIINSYKKRQNAFLTNAERQRKSRKNKAEKKMSQKCHKNVTPMSHESNARVEKSRVEKSRVNKDRETPAQKARRFFKSIEEKDEEFSELIKKLSEKNIPTDLAGKELKNFYSYWTELNKSGTKERWEQEKTFMVERRLANWFSRIGRFDNNKPKGKRVLR